VGHQPQEVSKLPRKTGFPTIESVDEVHYRGLTPIVTSIDVIPVKVTDLTDTVDESNKELGRIRRTDELILGQDVENGEQ